jgi:ABC-2 type transport system permease protein
MLIRPRSLILQVLGSKIDFNKTGRAILSILVFIGLLIYSPNLIVFNKLVTIFLMLIGTMVIYASLFVLKGGITFFTTQSLELMNIFTDGGRELSQYPLNIYKKWVLNFFSFVVPLAFVNYYPLLYVIGKSDNILYMFAPLISFLFIFPCYFVWRMGIKNYKSVGS